MVPPLVSSAYIAQQLADSSASASTSHSPSGRATSGKPGLVHDAANDDSSSEASDSDDSDDDGGSLIEERFLDPLSPESIFMKAIAYSRVLSPVGHKFALDFPLRVLAVVTSFTESLNGDIHTLRALDGDKELAISHSRITLPEAEEVASSLSRRAREASPSPELPPTSAFSALALSPVPDALVSDTAGPSNTPRRTHARRPSLPAPTSGTATPAERTTHEAASARPFGDARLAEPPLRQSPSRGTSRVREGPEETREELLQWYHFTAAGQRRQSTALDRLLDGVQAAREVGDGADAALPRPPVSVALEGGAPIVRVGAPGGEEYVFELVEEEAEEERDEGDSEGGDGWRDTEAEAAEREREELERRGTHRRRRALRDLVGR